MPGTTDGQYAHDVLLSFEPLSYHGACWYYVWQAYARAGAWTNQGSTPTAIDGWNASWGKHPGDRNPPPGAAIWLGRRYDGNMAGDVFIAGQFDGDHAATDQPYYGVTGTTTLQARIDLCGREYLGWTDHVLDCPIALGGQPEPEPEPEPETTWRDDEMDYYAKAKDDTQGRVWKMDNVTRTKRQLNPSEWASIQGSYAAMKVPVPLASDVTSKQITTYANTSIPSSASYSSTEGFRRWVVILLALIVLGVIVAIVILAYLLGTVPAEPVVVDSLIRSMTG